MIKHPCIRPGCANTYEDDEPDHYYCPSCNEARKKIAAEIDRKIGSQPRAHAMSDLAVFESQAKTINGPNGRTISFAPTKL